MTEPAGIVVEPTGQPSGFDRLRSVSSRTVVLILVGLILAGLGLSGRLSVSADVDIERAEAIEIARPRIDFEPVDADARLVRQGVGLRAVWAVSFSIPGQGRDDFERHTTVELDARTGEIFRVSYDRDPAANADGDGQG